MKKLLSMLVLTAMLLSASVLAVSAAEYEYITDRTTDYYELNAAKVDEIYDYEAGIASTKWTVPYLRVTPELDGKIGVGEYEPFENYQDYLFYSMRITRKDGQNPPEEFEAFLDATKEGFFDAYWGWDGQYLYMAFYMDCVDGYFCDPVGMYGGSSYLYACTSVQVGLGQADCSGRDYTELGFGINQNDNSGVTHKWTGPSDYTPDAQTDVAGEYNETTKRLVIEYRINIQVAMDLAEPVKNGDQAKLCWLLSVGGDGNNERAKQVSFCHGIGGTKSNKFSEYFATITFDGLPDGVDIPITEREEIGEQDKEYDLRDVANFAKDEAINAFDGKDATIEKITEGDETFMRITATGDQAYVFSSQYPRSVSSATKFAVIKYRTSSDKAKELGLIYKSTTLKEYDLTETAYDIVKADGNWHYLYIDMSSEAHWQDWIVSLGIVPFVGIEGAAGESVDIAWIKFYHDDPWDIFESDWSASTTTEAETEAPATTEAETEAPTTAEQTEAPTEPAATEAEKSEGCGSVVAAPALVLVALIGTALIVKKKD